LAPLFWQEWKDAVKVELLFNISGRWAWWRNGNVLDVLREHGYQPEYRWYIMPRATMKSVLKPECSSSQSGCSDGRSAAGSVPYPPPHRQGARGIVIRDRGDGSSSGAA
jgi:hypothetical protein